MLTKKFFVFAILATTTQIEPAMAVSSLVVSDSYTPFIGTAAPQKSISVDEFQKLIKMYSDKCPVLGSGETTSCFLTAKDLNPLDSPDDVILFRGENAQFSAPLSSSFFRWATSDKGICGDSCEFTQLTKYFYIAIESLSYFFEPSVYFSKDALSWKNEDGTPVNKVPPGDTDPRNKNLSAMEVILKAHISIHKPLWFENDRRKMFDPFISFSTNPEVAAQFSDTFNPQTQEILEKGAVWEVRLPKEKLVAIKDCSNIKLEVGKIYDFQNCHKVMVASVSELELDAFLFLPSIYDNGSIRGQHSSPKQKP